MTPAKLKLLLSSGSLTGDRLTKVEKLCHDWYLAEPSLVTFTISSLFKNLVDREWNDGQGVASALYDPFQKIALPALLKIVDIMAATPAAEPITELDQLVIAYRDSIKATP